MRALSIRDIIYILSVILLLVAFIKIEVYLIYKSKEGFKKALEAFKELKKAKEDLRRY